MDFVRIFRDTGKAHAGTYIAAMIKPVKSWLAFNGITTTGEIKIAGLNSRTSLKDERLPTQEELRSIFLSGDSRERLACAMMAFTGMRPQVLGNYRGTDGLMESAIMAVEVITGLKFSVEEKVKMLSLKTEEFQERSRDVTKGKQAMALNNGN